MDRKSKEKLKNLVESLYRINAGISENYITKIKKIDYDGICNINECLGELIRRFREILK